MNSTPASNGASALAALSAQRLLDGRQLGNGGREILPGSEGAGFASLLKDAQQASSGHAPERAQPCFAAPGTGSAEPRRAEPPRSLAPQPQRTDESRKSVPDARRDAVPTAAAPEAPSDAAKPNAGANSEPNPTPQSKTKARAAAAPATPAAQAAVPGQADASAEATAGTAPLPESTLSSAPPIEGQDPEQELTLSLPALAAALAPATSAVPVPVPSASPMPAPLVAANPSGEALLGDAPGLAAPTNALPLAPNRRASGSLPSEASAALPEPGSPSPTEANARPTLGTPLVSSMPERAEPNDASAAANPASSAAPQALPTLLKAAMVEPRTHSEPPAEAAQVKGSFSLAGLASTPAPSLQATGSASALASVSAPLASPAFADELGTQVAIWSRQGVQEAELRLNPAEMGPVQVRIQLDGQVAQVRFVAEQAPTREALQAALPQLAQALSAEGLQWGGGEVQSQLQQQMQQNAQQDARQQAENRGSAEAQRPLRGFGGQVSEPLQSARPAGQKVGLLDLYA